MKRHLVLVPLLMYCAADASIAHAFDWNSMWRTPDQQAARLLQQGKYAELQSVAPSTEWSGIGHYKSADYAAAAAAFGGDESVRSLYNRATAEVQTGDYASAIAHFTQLLETDSLHSDALHNKQIAEKLLELEQQSQQQDQGQQGEEGQQGQQGEQGEQSGEKQQSAPGEQDQPGDSQAAEPGDPEPRDEQNADQQSAQSNPPSADGETGQGTGEQPIDQRDREEEAKAAAALAAEAQQQAEQSPQAEQQEQSVSAVENDRPLTEQEQATEQWLRRIPDDPAGLLRRKLQQSHNSEYPEVVDSAQPW